MRLEIRTATAADVPNIVKMWARSFNEDVLDLNFFPRTSDVAQPSPQRGDIYTSDGYGELRHRAAMLWREERMMNQITNDDSRRLHRMMVDCDVKSSDGKERVVGYVHWILPNQSSTPALEEKTDQKGNKKGEENTQVEGLNYDLLQKYSSAVETREKFMGEEGDYWEAFLMCVGPAYFRRGVDRALLNQGLKLAEEQGKDFYVDSTPAGLSLYLALGFKDVGEVVFDDLKIGGQYKVVHCVKRYQEDE